MSRALALCLGVTDIGFLLYWAVAALMAAGLVAIPPEAMYADYGNPRVSAWNWSFFPLDVIFSVVGLAAVRASRREDLRWRPLALISLVLTMTAGGMAVAYWLILGEFNAPWFFANLVLLLWPLLFLPGLVRELGRG